MTPPIHVVTSWSEQGKAVYGDRFLSSYRQHWTEFPLYVFEDTDLMDLPNVREFRKRESDEETRTDKLHRAALKWAWKVFAITHRDLPDDGWRVWIDADVLFHRPPDRVFWEEVLPDAADISALLRPWAYASETGFVAYNLASKQTRKVLAGMQSAYLDGWFRRLSSWTDGAVFDESCRLAGALINNLTRMDPRVSPVADDLHVWPTSPLGVYMSHQKGPVRKSKTYGARS